MATCKKFIFQLLYYTCYALKMLTTLSCQSPFYRYLSKILQLGSF